jgi:mevalonate pyrophosphate decarboxylase
MSYEVTYDAERDCIVTRIDGKLDTPVAEEFLAEVARVISTSGCERILDDLRGAELTLSTGELYFAPRLVSEAGIPREIRSAIIVTERDWPKYSFLELVARNQAHTVKVFIDPDEAGRWLME